MKIKTIEDLFRVLPKKKRKDIEIKKIDDPQNKYFLLYELHHKPSDMYVYNGTNIIIDSPDSEWIRNTNSSKITKNFYYNSRGIVNSLYDFVTKALGLDVAISDSSNFYEQVVMTEYCNNKDIFICAECGKKYYNENTRIINPKGEVICNNCKHKNYSENKTKTTICILKEQNNEKRN